MSCLCISSLLSVLDPDPTRADALHVTELSDTQPLPSYAVSNPRMRPGRRRSQREDAAAASKAHKQAKQQLVEGQLLAGGIAHCSAL
eukprot:1110749-Rhodomonas_salina.2